MQVLRHLVPGYSFPLGLLFWSMSVPQCQPLQHFQSLHCFCLSSFCSTRERLDSSFKSWLILIFHVMPLWTSTVIAWHPLLHAICVPCAHHHQSHRKDIFFPEVQMTNLSMGGRWEKESDISSVLPSGVYLTQAPAACGGCR